MEETPGEKSSEPELKQIRTFQGDVVLALEQEKESLVSIRQAELAKGAGLAKGTGSKRKGVVLLFITVVLLALGAAGIWYTYLQYVKETAVPEVSALTNRFFVVDGEISMEPNLSRLDLISAISQAASQTPPDQTRHFLLNLDPQALFKALDFRAPGPLLRSFGKDFMLGSFGQSIFLLIDLVSFENAFAGMLEWEKNLTADIGPIFATREILRESTSTPVFIDVADRNKDVRALELGGEQTLFYSFFDNNMVIITDSIDTLRIIIDRLTREKLSR